MSDDHSIGVGDIIADQGTLITHSIQIKKSLDRRSSIEFSIIRNDFFTINIKNRYYMSDSTTRYGQGTRWYSPLFSYFRYRYMD